jgi:hypothetical protein
MAKSKKDPNAPPKEKRPNLCPKAADQEECKVTYGGAKNVPADALRTCGADNIRKVQDPITGHYPKKVTDYKRADALLKCGCNRKRNAQIRDRTQECTDPNSGRMADKMPVNKHDAPCTILDQNEICARVKNNVPIGPMTEFGSDPVGGAIKMSMMVNGLFYTKHAAKGENKNKMDKMLSLNTNPFDNPFCIAMNGVGCQQKACNGAHKIICGDCYSITTMSRAASARWHFNNNLAILSRGIICESQMPSFAPSYPASGGDREMVRFNAEGELINNIHLINLINIAASNPKTTCTLFTKRWDILDDVINNCGYWPPTNMPIIYSNPYVDLPMTFAGLGYDFGHKMPPNPKYPLIPSAEWLQNGIVTGIFNVVHYMPREEAAVYVREHVSSLHERVQKCHLACFGCKACYPEKGSDSRKFVVVELLKDAKEGGYGPDVDFTEEL